jgi:hypothetical protein
MFTLVYVSSATALCGPDEVTKILHQSRDNNSRLGITGMLLHMGGNFMQALEGPEQAVLETYERVKWDPRHRGVMTLLQQPIEQRSFPAWSMDFRGAEDLAPAEAAATREFIHANIDARTGQDRPATNVLRLLASFRRSMR